MVGPVKEIVGDINRLTAQRIPTRRQLNTTRDIITTTINDEYLTWAACVVVRYVDSVGGGMDDNVNGTGYLNSTHNRLCIAEGMEASKQEKTYSCYN
jgi:hypothetical protein